MISIPIVLPVCTDNAQVALNVGPHIPYGGSARAPQLYIRAALSHEAVSTDAGYTAFRDVCVFSFIKKDF
jgi:hypothetical protein